MEKYKLYQSNLIKDNQQDFIHQCNTAHELILRNLNLKDSTWDYDLYNIFSVTSTSVLFYKLFQELNHYVRSFIGDDRPLWVQSWLNYHKGEKLEENLKMHGHSCQYHGYISIDPKNTTTLFKNGLQIDNKIGQIYIGPSGGLSEWDHCVKINQPYRGNRITIGFDISTLQNTLLNPSFFPFL